MKFLAVILAVAALAIAIVCEDDHYRLRQDGQASDQAVLDHRDSAYTSMTWVGSPSENYLQLRFFDKVEGGLCLRPSRWTTEGRRAGEIHAASKKNPLRGDVRFAWRSALAALDPEPAA